MNAINAHAGFFALETPRSGGRMSRQTLRVLLYGLLVVTDCAALVAGFAVTARLDSGNLTGTGLCLLLLPIYVGIAFNSEAYGQTALTRPTEGMYRAIKAWLFTAAALLFFAFFFQIDALLSRFAFVGGAVLSGALLVIGRVVFDRYAQHQLAGSVLDELLLVDSVEMPPVSASVTVADAQLFDLRPDAANPMMLDRLGKAVRGFDRVVIACPPERRGLWALLLKGANVRGEIISTQLGEIAPMGVGSFMGQETLAVSVGPLSLRSRARKRTLDLSITVPLLMFLTPLLLIVALAIKLESRGSVFFVQQRMGRGNRLFSMYKLRSMRAEECDSAGHRSATRDDSRITRVGRFIRATSIDELPQLLNVLRGDMSLVGPRPHALGSLAGSKLFWEVDERYWHRHATKPGITGLAQVRGYRGGTVDANHLSERLRADLEYLQGWTLMRDVAILLATFKVLIHRNAY